MNEEMEDKQITCVEPGCGEFTWTVRDQEFYAEKGYTQPKRCRVHAKARRAFFDEHPQKTGKHDRRPREANESGY